MASLPPSVPPSAAGPNGWSSYSRLVLHELKEHKGEIQKLQKDVGDLNVEVGKLTVKAGVWGAIGGIIPAAIALAYVLLKATP